MRVEDTAAKARNMIKVCCSTHLYLDIVKYKVKVLTVYVVYGVIF